MNVCLLCFIGLQTLGSPQAAQEPAAAAKETPVGALKREALALKPLVNSGFARDFLKATERLPATIPPRAVYHDDTAKTYKIETTDAPLAKDEKSKLTRIDLDDSFYWTTKYGSPLAYTRPLDVLGTSGLERASGLKILDFGYGTIGHLRLLASLGANVTGVDVDPLLHAVYSAPGDQGQIKNPQGPDGQLRLIIGRFPSDSATTTAVGGDYDLIISKNTLKNGYVHPERPVEKRRLLNLDVDDAAFVNTLHRALKPGGRVLIYNLSPAPSPPGQPYKNWADGRCPFAKEVWEAAGFLVVAFDKDDSPAARDLGHALGWDQGSVPMDLKTDLFASYSLMRRREDKNSR